jgi:DNA polymerase III delta prime subunit
MEIFSSTTRFALACNQANKIIEPIQSRCAVLRYAKLRDEEVLKRVMEVCEMEEVRFDFGKNNCSRGHCGEAQSILAVRFANNEPRPTHSLSNKPFSFDDRE